MPRSAAIHPADCLALGCVLAAVVTLVGCGESSTAPITAANPTPLAAAAAKARAVTEATANAAAPKSAKDAADEAKDAEKIAYTPPFPDREEMFQPPRQAPRAIRSRGGDVTDDVVLMGFANLGQPQVVLAINGMVKPMAGGDELAGVRVISIAPPRAVLQRGRSRWTASIE
ncbi:MAG: hypothetical protein AAF805_00610 [Planctomycetota bacterium]